MKKVPSCAVIDSDEDEVKKYNVGNVLPVFIFFDGDKEIYFIAKNNPKLKPYGILNLFL